VAGSYRTTPGGWPWIIHAAEGLDDEAGIEFERLDALGCLGPNTLLVHGIALDHAQRARLDRAAAGLIWCPSSNLHLFGKTADVAELAAHGRVALGTDSRLSGAGDLLDELRLVGRLGVVDDSSLESLVTSDSAHLLRLTDRGELRAGARADILILPARTRFADSRRADVRLVLIDGIVRYGDKDYAQRMVPRAEWTEIRVDGRAKILDSHIAEQLSHARTSEPGLEVSNVDMEGGVTASTDKSGVQTTQAGGKRLKVVLYNPQAVFFTMPLALLAVGSELDPDRLRRRDHRRPTRSGRRKYRLVSCRRRAVPWRHRAHRRADLRRTPDFTGRETGASDDSRRMGRLASFHVRARMSAREIG